MTSSTSSSEAVVVAPAAPVEPPATRRTERWIALVLIAVLALLEVATRGWLVPASKDLARFAQYRAEAHALLTAPGPTLVFVGNSTTQAGVDLDRVAEVLGARLGQPVRVGEFVADGAGIRVLSWLVEHTFWKQRLAPAFVVMPFFGHLLEDSESIEVGRLARAFVEPGDWPALFRRDLPDLEQRAELLLSSFWATFAVRDRIQERVLGLLPGYKATVTRLHATGADAPVRTGPPQYQALARFLADAHAHGMQVLFVAYPTLDLYPLPDGLRRTIEQGGAQLVDLRQLGLSAADYSDEIHVNAHGEAVFTARLLEVLVATWPALLEEAHR